MEKYLSKKYLNDLSYQLIGAAIEVHKALGPGLLETVYHKCLKHELSIRKIQFQTEMVVPVYFKGIEIEADLKCDLYIDDCLVVELKAVEEIAPIHEAQLLTYMQLLESPKGILINFNCTNLFKEGQKTYVNEIFRMLPDD